MFASSVLTLLILGIAEAYTGVRFQTRRLHVMIRVRSAFSLASSSPSADVGDQTGIVKKPLTAADILSRARKSVGMSADDEPENSPVVLLFENHVLQDIQKTLFTLEKRVKNGPRSLSIDEINELEAASDRIIHDMKTYTESQKNIQPSSKQNNEPNISSDVILESPTSLIMPRSSTIPNRVDDILSPYSVSPAFQKRTVIEQQIQQDAHAAVDTFLNQLSSTSTDDNNENDDGPKYNGRGGFGLASGTRNTYFIPGMDEMSPEEYRDALQKSVSDRQALRKERGIVGNRSSQNYLDQLGK